MYQPSLKLMLLVLAGAAVTATAATPATKPPATQYKMEFHAVGSGGSSTGGDYRLDGTTGQWSVGMLKMTHPSGYAIDSGIWPPLSKADCSASKVSFSTDLSVCR